MKDNILLDKSFIFAVRIVKLYKYLCSQKKEYVLSKQLLRSGTSIGANINEAQDAQSKNDFISKLSISLKEARETKYWIELLRETDYLTDKEANNILEDLIEVIKLLVSIIKTTYDPWADSKEVKHEYGLELIDNGELKIDNYDALVLAVAHEEFKKLNSQLSNINSKLVKFDIKSILDETDGRL